MVGIPLMNLGNALAGLTQGYQNYQTNQIQNAIRQLALSQAQRQQQAATLAGLGLSSGLLSQQPISPITNSPQPQPSQPPQPPPPGMASPPAAVPAAYTSGQSGPDPANPGWGSQPGYTTWPVPPPANGNGGSSEATLPDVNVTAPAPEGGQTGTDAQPANKPQVLTSAPPSAPNSKPTTYWQGTPVWLLDSDGKPIPPQGDSGAESQPASPAATTQPPAQQPAGASPAAQPQGTSAPAAGGSAGADQAGSADFKIPAAFVRDLFRSIDPSDIAQRLERLAPPGTDPSTIYEATSDLLQLANGNKAQQTQAMQLGHLLGIQMQVEGRAANVAAQQTGATGRTQMQQEGADRRAQLSSQTRLQVAQLTADARRSLEEFKQDHIDTRYTARLNQTATRIQAAANAAKDVNLSRQASTIRAQIATIKPAADGTYTDDQQATLKAYADQLQKINEQLAQNYGASTQPPAR